MAHILLDVTVKVTLGQVQQTGTSPRLGDAAHASFLELHGVDNPGMDPAEGHQIVFASMGDDDGVGSHKLQQAATSSITAPKTGLCSRGRIYHLPGDARVACLQVAHFDIRPDKGIKKDFPSEEVDGGDLNELDLAPGGNPHFAVNGNSVPLVDSYTTHGFKHLVILLCVFEAETLPVSVLLQTSRVTDLLLATLKNL
jgi:hypothetical protein